MVLPVDGQGHPHISSQYPFTITVVLFVCFYIEERECKCQEVHSPVKYKAIREVQFMAIVVRDTCTVLRCIVFEGALDLVKEKGG